MVLRYHSTKFYSSCAISTHLTGISTLPKFPHETCPERVRVFLQRTAITLTAQPGGTQANGGNIASADWLEWRTVGGARRTHHSTSATPIFFNFQSFRGRLVLRAG